MNIRICSTIIFDFRIWILLLTFFSKISNKKYVSESITKFNLLLCIKYTWICMCPCQFDICCRYA